MRVLSPSTLTVLLLGAAASGPGLTTTAHAQEATMEMKQASAVLVVDRIEPVLPFWVDRLGFQQTQSVPLGDGLGFVTLVRDGVELMYQSRASVREDVPALAESPPGPTFLFIQVSDLDAVERALEGVDPVIPRRQTFYGADELIVRDPAGHVITFAEFAEEG